MSRIYTYIVIALCALFGLLTLNSCTKEYTCKCEMSYSGAPGLPQNTVRTYSITDTKKNATKLCEEKSDTYEENGITTIEECKLW